MPHGTWLPWLSSEFGWNTTTAWRMMQVAKQPKFSNLENLNEFAPSILYLLSEPGVPESARNEAIERAGAGEKIDLRAAKEIKVNHQLRAKPGPPPEPAYAIGQTVYGLVDPFVGIQMVVVEIGSRSASLWMYECRYMDKAGFEHYRTFYESAISIAAPQLKIAAPQPKLKEELPARIIPPPQSISPSPQIVSITSTARIHVLTEELEAYQDLLQQLFYRCSNLPVHQRDIVFADGLGREIEEWLYQEP
ncbi:MAG: hypothetical protein AAGA75_24455 [Cyanobacteria bacterium P01_E01_bin.6]